jgi:hypothetical protein
VVLYLFIQLMDLQPPRSQVPLSQTFPTQMWGRSLFPLLGVPGFRNLLRTAGNLLENGIDIRAHENLV